jgi:hypothetical protein
MKLQGMCARVPEVAVEPQYAEVELLRTYENEVKQSATNGQQ